MYTLTLTRGERRAIDWVGSRYAHGDRLSDVLMKCDQAPDDADWRDECPIIYSVPEHLAQEIYAIAEECEWRWDCFSPAFALAALHAVEPPDEPITAFGFEV